MGAGLIVCAIEVVKRRDRQHDSTANGVQPTEVCEIVALDFNGVYVLGIELRPDVGGNAGVGDGNAVEQPGDLMPAANVDLVVDHVCAGNIVGDHGHAVGLRGSRSIRDLLPVNDAG